MSTPKPQIRITFTHSIDPSTRIVCQPRKVLIKSQFGAQPRRSWIELYAEDSHLPFTLGDSVEITINQTSVFKGHIIEKRIDSIDDPVSLVAERDPTREWNRTIHQHYEDFTIPAVLQDAIQGSGLQLSEPPLHFTRFSRLTFSDNPVYFVIDLLAKLADNAYWTVDDDGTLRFRPSYLSPDHSVFLRRDLFTVNLRQNHDDAFSRIEIECGVRETTTYQKTVIVPNLSWTAPTHQTKIFARPITTPDVYAALERAILHHMTAPRYSHYIDLLGAGEHIQPGDTVRFVVDDFSAFPLHQVFRIKQRDLTYSHEELTTRLHLTTGFESAPGYFFYLRADQVARPQFLAGKTGVFQLDVSSFDSPTRLDAA